MSAGMIPRRHSHRGYPLVMVKPAAILITGATDGLGRCLAIALAAQGANLLLH